MVPVIFLKVGVVVLVSYLLYHFAEVAVGRIVRTIVRPGAYSSQESEKKREDTLIPFFVRIVRTVILAGALFQLFAQFGIDPAPLIAAAGIVGIALGFGSQYLVRDFFTGTLLVFENQYRVGDSVCLGDVCGDVEQVTLRITRLRDADGVVHFVPHGEIKRVSNKSRGFSRINITIAVPYQTKLEQLMKVINEAGKAFAEDPAWKDVVRSAPRFMRVEEFGEAKLTVRIMGETAPGRNVDAAGEFKSRLKLFLDDAGIFKKA